MLILGLIYLYFTLYVFFCYVPTTIVTKPWNYCLNKISSILYAHTGEKTRTILYGAFVLAVIIITVFSLPEKEESPRIRRLITIFGMLVFIGGTWICSKVETQQRQYEFII